MMFTESYYLRRYWRYLREIFPGFGSSKSLSPSRKLYCRAREKPIER